MTEHGDQLLDRFFYAEPMQAIFSDRNRLQAMLDFEAALARAGEKAGIVPPVAASSIEHQCRAELFDVTELSGAVTLSGNPAIPLIKSLDIRGACAKLFTLCLRGGAPTRVRARAHAQVAVLWRT